MFPKSQHSLGPSELFLLLTPRVWIYRQLQFRIVFETARNLHIICIVESICDIIILY